MNINYEIKENVLFVGNRLFKTSFENVKTVTAAVKDGEGLSEPYVELTAVKTDGSERLYCVWEDLPLVWIPKYSESTLFKFEGEHWLIDSIKLTAFTDNIDTLTKENEDHLFRGKLQGERQGDIFFFKDVESGNAVVVISETADYTVGTLTVSDYTACFNNGKNGVAIGFCKADRCEKLCRDYQRRARRYDRLVTMSNTWGDRNGSTRVCFDFVIKEIDEAKNLGIDIVQVDDGWQMGDTAWVSERDEQKRRTFKEGYWDVNYERFPNELTPVTEYAKSHGIRLGMWFAPDSRNNFEHFERDFKVLEKAYKEWGVRFFKLDMYWVDNDFERDCMLKLLEKIHALGKDVTVQMDVTRYSRLNYLCARQYGTVFVENRYTYTANSFPHRVLRNLWMISKYIPASRFQFEIVNPDLNDDKYKESDPFKPSLYSMDYLFASVMLSNPLFWMELQYLSESRKSELKNIMGIWKEHRENLAQCDVCPIGDKPSGRSFTGFYVSKDNSPEYLLIFREVTDGEYTVIPSPVANADVTVLASNCECDIRVEDGKIHAKLNKQRSYAFIKLN